MAGWDLVTVRDLGGWADRVEIFGAFRVDTRIDRDFESPAVFQPTNAAYGGLVNAYPFVRQDWTGDNLGDLLVGVKVNLLSEWRQQPAAVAVRGIVKLPTGKKDAGVSTGEADGMVVLEQPCARRQFHLERQVRDHDELVDLRRERCEATLEVGIGPVADDDAGNPQTSSL